MTPSAQGHPLDEVALYALDALDPGERIDVERHLADCPDCRVVLDLHYETLSGLAQPHPADPPAAVWDSIAAAIGSQRPRPVAARAHHPRHRSRPEATASPASTPTSSRRGIRVLAGLGAAAAIVALAFVVGRQLDGSSPGVRGPADVALSDPSSVVGQLSSPDGEEVARVVAGEDGAFVWLDDLSALAEDQAYQLWLLDGAEPVSVGVISRSGGVTAVALPDGAHRLAVTVEASGGVTSPTGPVVARGTLPARD